jgi:peptide deformylase
MAVRAFIPYPDKRLAVVCEPVAAITDVEREIWRDMFDSMYDMPGVGLAACQIGITRSLAVVDAGDGREDPVHMANPVILHASAVMREHQEGSPNLPGVWANLERPRAVTVGFMDENGAQVERDYVGLWATSVQHQVDHLNGRMFFDRLSKTKRKMLIAKAQKLSKKGLI